jgi:hypothetical protein
MIKILAAGVWSCAVALGASWAAASWRAQPAPATVQAEAKDLELRKARPLNIPVVADGAVQGYVIAQFSFTVDKTAAKQLPVSPEAILLDEAFRAIYSDDRLNFRHLEKYDLDRLTKDLIGRVRQRLSSDAVRDVIVQEFNFVSLGDLKR